MLNHTVDSAEGLDSWTRHLNICINFFYLIFGNIGNLLKIAFFLQKPLRFLPCTTYILYSTLSDFITLNNLPALQLLIHLYPQHHWIKVTVDWSNSRNESDLWPYSVSTYDLLMCKVRTYLHMFSTDLSSQMLVFACINRFCFSHRRRRRSTSDSYFIRLFCHIPNVHKLCLGSLLLCSAMSLQHVFNFTVYSPSQGCIPRLNILWTLWILLVHCCLLPALMIVFGVLTLRNVRQLSVLGHCLSTRRRAHLRTAQHRFIQMCSYCLRCRNSVQHQIENQLTAMIISEIVFTVSSSLPYGIYAFHRLLAGIQGSNDSHWQRREWVTLFIRTSMYLEASCGFYIYLMTLTSLRKRFCRMIVEKFSIVRFCINK